MGLEQAKRYILPWDNDKQLRMRQSLLLALATRSETNCTRVVRIITPTKETMTFDLTMLSDPTTLTE